MRGQRLADLLVVDVAVVRAVERHFEAVRVAGFRQQLLRALLVVRQALLDRGVVVSGDGSIPPDGCDSPRIVVLWIASMSIAW